MVRYSHTTSVYALNWQAQITVALAHTGHLSAKCDGTTHSFVHQPLIKAS